MPSDFLSEPPLHTEWPYHSLIYHPLQTPFLQNGQGKGAQTINGIGMLIHQAAYAFKLMTGQEMPVEEVEKKIIEDIQTKGEE